MIYQRHVPRGLLFLAALACCQSSSAGLLLSEIHYNGPFPGSDPDEFVELANTSDGSIALGGFGFSSGISFSFPEESSLESREVLVIARNVDSFRDSFPAFSGKLFDFGGSLSNSGETLSLQNSAGELLWSVTYDDSGAWPRSADGGGDSLQLRDLFVDPSLAGSWIAAAPTPGNWSGLAAADESSAQSVPTPGTALLTALGMLGLLGPRGRSRPEARGCSQN